VGRALQARLANTKGSRHEVVDVACVPKGGNGRNAAGGKCLTDPLAAAAQS
jgi:hypothetical protein